MKTYLIKIVLLNIFFINLFFASPFIGFSQLIEWRGPDRTGVYPDNNLLKQWPDSGPELVWIADSLGMGYSSPTITKDAIYITGRKGDHDYITALDHKGNILWETLFGKAWTNTYRESRTTPTFSDGKLFMVSGNGDLAVLDTSGTILWSKNFFELYESTAPKFGISESPLVYDGKVIVSPGGSKASIVAYDINTGDLVWEAPPVNDEAQYGSPKLFKHKDIQTIATLTKNRLIAVDANTGDTLWTFRYIDYAPKIERARTNHSMTPIYKDGYIFITSGYDYTAVKLKLPKKGKQPDVIWSNSDMDPHHGGVVLVGNYLYSSNWDDNSKGGWTCINWETGKTMWKKEWQTKGSIISADSMLFCYEERRGHVGLFKADPNTFDLISEFQITKGQGPHWAHPVINNGTLYIRHGQALMVYSIK